MICDKDPTFRRSFLNPFLGTNDRATTATFQDILEVGKESVCNCRLFAEVLRMDALRFFPQMHLDRITCLFRIECFVLTLSLSYCIAELPSYHLNAESLAIFSEQLTDLQMLRQVNSQTSLLRSSYRSSIFSQRPSENPSKGRSSSSASKTNQHAIGAANEILPLVMILWDEPRRESEGIHESRSMSRDYSR